MKVLDAGDHPFSNADVLDWIQRKRAQHTREDAEDKASAAAQPSSNKKDKHDKHDKTNPRPKNFMRMLERTERELTSNRYPYAANPSSYTGDARRDVFQAFALELENTMQDSLESEWSEKLKDMTPEQIEKLYEPQQERKCLTATELLMLYNHAPTCVEMLQPMIESVEERFSAEEQATMVEIVVKHLRKDEGL
ncbi:uncharacterized protein K489DRAFT_368680 [Dissoconium aciculare CBS 342.82]|jgi:hypothetical protein|uniref:DNA-directed RNA polymerase III subunit RPC9 n=1 Tax=Dissoconium aciculare CBS 342.82 TaxID=1314786 RepID=A0A6J3MC09_9PEZI|nr:uncharacterized protein K489DRAFT_368680 [Dissoconium aciculare CBS 342.82]KAF1825540.1 hypothetical protein K489DRAFT_368680 [Dissoconium aciculare CBS 342.82]